jgi:hypothetical protein
VTENGKNRNKKYDKNKLINDVRRENTERKKTRRNMDKKMSKQ